MFYVYVLQNPQGILYKGHTDNLANRLEQHRSGSRKDAYTKSRGPWKLVYQEQFSERNEAAEREKFFKSGKGREFLKQVLGAPH